MPFDPSAIRSGGIFSDNPNYQGAVLCYINGIEVPIMGCDVSYGVWQIPTFRIQLLPDILLERLGNEDRVPVQLFYLDQWVDIKHPEWRLLVDGEIVGWSYSSTESGRALTFQCMSHIQVFQQLYFFYMTNVDDIVAAQSPDVQASGFSQSGLLYPYCLFHQGLFSVPNRDPANPDNFQSLASVPEDASTVTSSANSAAHDPIKAPYELVTNVIKGVISSQVPNERRAVPMMNFFARHIRKTRFHNRWVRLPILEDPSLLSEGGGVFPIFRAVRSDEALNAMQQHMASQVSNAGPVWNLFQQILSMVYMEIAMIPNPACVRATLLPENGQEQEGKILGLLAQDDPLIDTTLRASGVSNATEASGSMAVNPQTPVRLAQYFVKPQFLFGIPPHCNVIFPSMITNWMYDENYTNQPTRIYVNDSVMTRLLRAQGSNREFMLHALTVGYPEEANALMHHRVASTSGGGGTPSGAGNTAAGASNSAAPAMQETGKNLLIWPEEYYKGPVTARMAIPSWFQMLRQFSNANANQNNPSTGVSVNNGTASGDTTSNVRPVTVRANSDINPVSAVPTIPQSATPQTPAAVQAPTGIHAPTYATRIVVGRQTRISLNGVAPQRFWLDVNSGLDPNTYMEAQQTALWPLPTPNQNRARQGRPRNATEAVPANQRRTVVQKMAQMVRLFLQHTPSFISGLSRDQLFAATFGIYWIAFMEQAVGFYWNWGFGNGKQYHDYPRRPWFVNPGDRQPYQGGVDHNDGARRYIGDIVDRYSRSLNVLLTGQIREPDFQQFITARPNIQEHNRFWLPYAPIRPDFLYSHLGYIGYYGSEHDHDRMSRAATGWGRTDLQASYFRRVKHLFDTNAVPEDIITVRRPTWSNIKPLLNAEDRAYLTANPGAVRRTVTRPVSRISVNPRVPQPGAAPAANPAPAVTIGPPAAPAQLDEATTQQAETFSQLFELYAQYEYLRQRYMLRQTSAQLKFQPYLIPGFPCVIFDSMRTRFHVMGYLQNITHSWSASGQMSTNVSVTCARTFPEFLNDVRNDAERFRARVVSAPAEIIDDIRTTIQDEAKAEEFYQRLLHGGARPANLPASFVFTNAMGYSRLMDTEDIEITGESVAANQARETQSNNPTTNQENSQIAPATQQQSGAVAGVSSGGQQTVTHNIDPNQELSPKGNIYQNAFDNYDIAMQLDSRPVCTLAQYIRFWHGGRSLNDCLATADVEGENNDFAYTRVIEQDVHALSSSDQSTPENIRGESERQPATYYTRIFRLRSGPGTPVEDPQTHQVINVGPPSDAERGYTINPILPSATTAGVSANYPQTRASWDDVLMQYRFKVRTILRPST